MIVRQLGEAGLADQRRRSVRRSQGLVAGHRREAVRLRPGQRQAAQSPSSAGSSARSRSIRIDHYLGKETVQNLAVFRFGNGLFEPIWNRRYIDSVQITVSETVGVEGRGEFYDETGALRDIVQNHALQLLAVFAMEPPVEFRAADLRDEKLKVLRAVRTMSPDDVAQNVVRGQYVSGWVEGHKLPSYREEPEVRPDSETETFVALKLEIGSWRWAGVPFYVRTGKASADSGDRGGGAVQEPAAGPLRAGGRHPGGAQHPGHPHPAR